MKFGIFAIGLLMLAMAIAGCDAVSKRVSPNLDNVATIAAAIKDYESDGVPLSALDNATVYSTLTKGNARMSYSPTAASKAAGRLLDPWGTPLRFARGQNGEVYVISAGPDGYWGPKGQKDNIVYFFE